MQRGIRHRSILALALAGAFSPCALAQDAPQQLEKIVVTGEKTERSLQDTAASVDVIDQRTLTENPSLGSTNDILDDIPNITTTGTGNLAPAVRGLDGTGPAEGGDAFVAGTRPRLGFQVDGRAANYNEIVFGNFSTWDVRQVEVFRGAQSLLQGRNSMAGTVVVKTNDPSFEPEIGARTMLGNYNQRQYAGVLNAPLLKDEVALRIAVDRQVRDSYVHGIRPYGHVGDPGEYDGRTLRAKLLVQPKALPQFSTLATFAHSDNIEPQHELIAQPYGRKIAAYPNTETFRTRTNSGTLESTWRFNERVKLENVLSYADFMVARTATPGSGNVRIDGHDFSWEPRLHFSGKDTSGLAGFYYFRSKQGESIDMFNGAFDDATTTVATYGELTHSLRSDLRLTLGARYEEEKRDREGQMIMTVDLNKTYHAFLPKAVLSWDAAPGLTVGGGVSRGYNAGGAGVSWTSFNVYEFDPEYAWTYEGFTRATLAGGKLLLNANIFYSRYKDIQLPFDTNPGPAWDTEIRNAERARTYGAELSATWLPIRPLRLMASVGLLQTRITKFGNNRELEGNHMARSPALTASFGAQYRHASGFEAGFDARYSESYYSDALNLSRGKIDPYWIVNTRVGYNYRNYRLFAFVRNVFDEDQPIYISAQSGTPPSSDNALLAQPRTVGVGVEAWF